MAVVTVLTAARTLELVNAAIINGVIDGNGDLVLQKNDGSSVNLGAVGAGSRPNTQAEINFTASDPDAILETITVTDDATDPNIWVDRLTFQFLASGYVVPRRTTYFNEYGELRVAPGRHNTTALRVFAKEFPDNPTDARSTTVPVIELRDDRTNNTSLWGVLGDGITVVKGIRMSYTLVLGPADAVPAGTPVDTVILRTS
jgi:hypothetical protein